MDNFYQDVNFKIYKKWMENLNIPGVSIKNNPHDSSEIFFKKDDIVGISAFYRDYLVEHEIFKTNNKQRIFYVHYQFINFKRSLVIFNDYIKIFKNYHHQKKLKVLLCCSAGYTSTYFVDGIKKFCKLLNISIEIEASSYLTINQKLGNYDLILLAPQIAYLVPKLMVQGCKNIYAIPPKIFASNDYQQVVEFILKHY